MCVADEILPSAGKTFHFVVCIMFFTSDDLLTVSLTINSCALVFNIVPKVRTLVAEKGIFRSFRRLRKTCRWFETRPWKLSKILTGQLLVWILVLMCLVAMCSTDVIKYPFRLPDDATSASRFLEIILGINLGRYCFCIIQNVFLINAIGKLRFRAEIIHHTVAVLCYSLSLSYKQNMLLGLIGIIMEANTVLDEIGKHMKEREKQWTPQYRRIVLISCAMALGFRGIIPLTFLIIAMFHQTPFVMDYAPLTVFFLSIIFFSVINVWLVLTNIQRLMKIYCYKSDGAYLNYRTTRNLAVLSGDGSQTDRQYSGRGRLSDAGGIQLSSQNNLGYVRPYENKNLTNNLSDHEKINLNNRKEFSKETLQLQITKDAFISQEKPEFGVLMAAESDVMNNRDLRVHDVASNVDQGVPYSDQIPLRNSGSSDSNHSGITLICPNDQTTQYSRSRRVSSAPRVHSDSSRRGSVTSASSVTNCLETTSWDVL